MNSRKAVLLFGAIIVFGCDDPEYLQEIEEEQLLSINSSSNALLTTDDSDSLNTSTMKTDVEWEELSPAILMEQEESSAGSLLGIYSNITKGGYSNPSGYVNDFDMIVNFQCPVDMFLTNFNSIHHNHYEDRRFQFGCHTFFENGVQIQRRSGTCEWSGYQNNFDGALSYTCPNGKFVAGIYSYHHNHFEDRRTSVYCCSMSTPTKVLTATYCDNSPFSTWDADVAQSSSYGAIAGLTSYHSNRHEDRIQSIMYCDAD